MLCSGMSTPASSPVPLPTIRRSGRTAQASLVVEAPTEATRALVERALAGVGTLGVASPGGEITGVISTAILRRAHVRITLSSPKAGETLVTADAKALDLTGGAQRGALRRLFETLMRQDEPGFKPDRWGEPVWVTALTVVSIAAVIVVMNVWVLPKMK